MKTYTTFKSIALLLLLTTAFYTPKGCAQTTTIVGIYNGANGMGSYPCPIQDNSTSSRAQYLYTAAELTSAGVTNGFVINQMGWVTLATTIAGHTIEGYTISIKNASNLATLSTSTWETGLTQVYGPTAFSYTSGYAGNIVFNTTNFLYNGTGLVVEVCGGVGSGSATFNPMCQFTSGFTQVMSHQYVVNGQNGCGAAAIANSAVTSYRPRLVLNKYCTPTYTSVCVFMWINNFSTTGGTTNITNNNSACSALAYGNFMGLNVTQSQGSQINFSVSDNAAYGEGMAIWVDWNQNGLFTDAGEQVWTSGGSLMPAVFTGSFSVPAGASLGATRMRVRSQYLAVPPDACSNLNYGETEDYSFTVTTPPPCSGTPTPGNTIASSTALCYPNSTTVNFSLQNNTTGTGVTYQWQTSSAFAGPYTNIAGATVSTYTVIPTVSNYYRCTVGCGAGSGISVPVYINIVPTPTMSSANSASICSGGTVSITFSSNVASNYTWIATNNPNTTGESITSQTTYTLTNTITNSSAVNQVVSYTVTPTSTVGGCVGTPQTIAVTVIPNITPSVTITADLNPLCSGQLPTFSAIPVNCGAGATYAWQTNFVNNGGTGTTYTPATVNSGDGFSVVVSATNTCQTTSQAFSNQIIETVYPVPTMTSANTDTICEGYFQIYLTADTSSSFSWYANDNPNTTGETTTTFYSTYLYNDIYVTSASNQVVNYFVTPTSTAGCVGLPQQVDIYVNKKPTITSLSASATTVCSGDNSTLSSASTSPSPANYCKPNTSCAFPDIITNVTFGGINRTSTCDNMYGGYTYYSAPNPTYAAGNAYTLSVSTGGDMEGAAVWIDFNHNEQFEASELITHGYAGTNPATYSLSYTIPATAANGTTMMRVRCLYAGDPSTTLGPCGNTTYGETEDYLITISGGVDGNTYTWSPASFLNSTSLASVTASGITSSITYGLTVTAPNGCTKDSTVSIFMNTIPVNVSATASPSSICSGGSSTLTVNATMQNPAYCHPNNDCGGGDYIIDVGFGAINSNNTCDGVNGYSYDSTFNPTFVAGTSYPFVADLNSSSDNISVWIDLDQNGVFDNSTELFYNDGQSSSTYSTYITIPASAFNGVTRMRVRSFFMYGTGSIDACTSDWDYGDGGGNEGETEDYSIQITGATAPINYTWSPGTFLSSTTGQTVSANGMTSSVTYTVSANAALSGCSAVTTNTVTVTVNPVPAMTSASVVSICSGNSVTIPLTSSTAATYTWIAADNPNTTGESLTSQSTGTLSNTITNNTTSPQTVIYTVTPTSSLGCVGASQTVSVTVNPKPGMTSTAAATICSGVALSLPFTSTVASTYTWIAANNANTTGESLTSQSTSTLNNTITNNTAVNQSVSYTVTPTSTVGGCVGNTQTVTVTVNPAPTMTSAATATICSGGTVTIPLTSNVAASYTWIAANNANTTGESTILQGTGTLTNTIINNITSVQTVTYTVTPTATVGGCAGTPQTVTVTVNPTPTMTSAGTATICSGNAVNIPLTSNVASTYIWIATDNTNTTGESLTSQSTGTINNTITNNTTSSQTVVYTVTPTSTIGSCAGNSQSVSVTVNPTPVMTSAATAAICSAGTVSIPLTSNVASTYTWIAVDNANTTGESLTSQSTGTLNNTITNNTTVVQTVSYTVTPTATTGGCVGSNQTVVVTVNPAPTMTSASTATICSGGTVSIALTSNIASSYTWIAANNVNTTGESTSLQGTGTLTNTIINNSASVQTVVYTVTPTAIAGSCVGAAQTVTVTVNPVPAMTSASTATICSGGTVSIPLTSNVASTYTWLATDNTNTTGESLTSQSTGTLSNTITNNTSSPQAVVYTVTPTSTVGSCAGNSQSVSVTVNPIPTMTNTATATICSGGTVNIPLTSTVASTYTWIATNNANTTGESTTSQSTSTLSNTITNNTTSVQSVTYTVTPTATTGGCVGSNQTVTVTVNPAPTMTSAVTATICSGGTVSIPLTSNIASSYTWIAANNANTTGESTGLQGTSTLSNTIFNTAAGVQNVIYTVTPTSTVGSCSGASQTVTVTVNSAPTMTSAGTATICSGGTVSIPLTSDVTSIYTWIASNNANTTGESLTSQSTSTLSNTITNNTASVQTVIYTVTPTSTVGSCAGNSQTVIVTVNPLPTVTANSTATTVCAGTSITLTGGGATSYSWSGGVTDGVAFIPASTTTYTVTGTSGAGCTNTANILITVNPLPTVTANSTATTVCAGTAITLTGGGAVSYTWTGGVTNGVSFVPASTTTYTVTGTNSNGCINTATIAITVNPIPTITVNSPTICPGGTATLTANGGTTYLWSTTQTINPISVSPGSTTSYTVTGTSLGCSNTAVATVTIGASLTITVNSPSICPGGTANLTASGGTSYVWSAGATPTGVNTADASPSSTTTYTVTGTTAGCSGTTTATVTVNPLPTVTVNSPTICFGQTANLTANGTTTYSWSAGATSTGVNTADATPATTTTYTVTGTSLGCSNTAVSTVTVTPLPNVTGSSPTICAGATATLTANGGTTYIWSPGATPTGVNTADATPATTTTYTVTGTTGACSNTATSTVTVIPLPIITVNSPTICAGSVASLTANGGSIYSWSAGATSTGINTAVATPVTTTTYTVTGTTGACSNTAVSTVTVNPLPTITVNSPTICAGSTASLTANGATTYSWSAGATPTGVNTADANPAVTTSYIVTGTDLGCSNSAVSTVTVNALPNVTANTTATTVCAGTSITLTGGGAVSYTWDNGVTNGVAFVPLSTATYIVTGTGANTCTNTASITITVNPLPVVTVNSPTVCFGQTASLTANGASSYSWSAGATATGTNTADASPVSTTNYTVTGTLLGCVSTAVSTVTVASALAITVNSPSICVGDTAYLVASGATSYVWSAGATPTGIDSALANPVATTTYIVTGTTGTCSGTATATVTVNAIPTIIVNSPTICAGATANLSANGGTTYTWSAGATSTGINTADASPATTATYTVTGTTLGCSNTAVSTVTVNQLPIVVASASATTICAGVSELLTGSGAVSYSWDNGVTDGVSFVPTATTTYILTGTDANTCVNMDTVLITVNPIPVITVNSPTVCPGGTATLIANGGTSYSWSAGATPTGVNTADVTPLSTSTYTVTGSDLGCSDTAVATVTIGTSLSITVNSPNICLGSTATLTATGATTYVWSAGVIPTGANTADASPIVTTTYTVTGTSGTCTGTGTATVTINPLIIADAGPTQIICTGDTTTLSPTVTGGTGGLNYSWTDGTNTYTTANIAVFPPLTTTYTLTVTDLPGCSATDTMSVIGNNGSDIWGLVTDSLGNALTTGYSTAILFKYRSFYKQFDTAETVHLSPTGYYHFSNVHHRRYIIKVYPDTLVYPNLAPSYYGNVFLWDSATVIYHDCGVNDSLPITMTKRQSPLNGPGKFRGRFTEGWNYTRHEGEPVRGIDVKVVHNPGGAYVTNTTTTPYTAADSGGYFYFDSIPLGCYDVYVDIPGLHRDSIWHICVTGTNTDFLFLDYAASDSSVYIRPGVVTGITTRPNETNFTVYPNPFIDATTIEYGLLSDSEVRLEVFDILGKKMETLLDGKQNQGIHTYNLNAPDKRLRAGVYFVTLTVNGSSKTQRVVVME